MRTLTLQLTRQSLACRALSGSRVLDFASLTAAQLQSRFGWVRSGLGALTDVAGAVRYGAHNLTLGSQSSVVTVAGSSPPTASVFTDPETGIDCAQLTFPSGGAGFASGNAGIPDLAHSHTAGLAYTYQAEVWVDRATSSAEFSFYLQSANSASSYDYWTGVTGTLPANTWSVITLRFVPANPASRLFVYRNTGSASSTTFRIRRRSLMLGGVPQVATNAVGSISNYVPTTTAAVYLMRTPDYTHGVPGLLLEGARTNIVSTNFANWAGSSGLSLVLNNAVSPSGQADACRVAVTATGSTLTFSPTVLPSFSGGNAAWSIYAKPDGIRYLQILWSSALSTEFANIDLQTGQVVGGTYTVAKVEPAANGYYRISIGSSLATAQAAVFLAPVPAASSVRAATYSGTVGIAMFLWQPDVVQGVLQPSSPIPNPTTGTMLRVADDQFLTGTALDAEIGAARNNFTIFMEWRQPLIVGASSRILYLGTNDYTRRIDAYTSGGSVSVFVNDGVVPATFLLTPTIANGALNKIAISVDGAAVRLAVNGASGGSLASTFGGAAMAERLRLLHAPGASWMDSVVTKLGLYPNRAMSIAEMQALTV